MSASTMTTFGALLKTRYAGMYETLLFSDRPFMGFIKKNEDFAGDGTVVPLVYGAAQGAAASSLATAQANSTNLLSKKFILTAGDYFGSVFMGDKVISASRKNMASFVDNQTAEIDGLYETQADRLALYMTGNSGNSIGRRASISSNTITLTEQTQVANFEVGQPLRASANDGSDVAHALRAGTAPRVTSIDATNGTVTVDNAALITAFANNDFLFTDGDFRGNTGSFIFHGVGSFVWVDESPTTIYSMVRTDHPQRLAGCRVSASRLAGLTIEDRLTTLVTDMVGTYKGKGPDKIFLNPVDWQRLERSLRNQGQRPLTDDSTKFGYKYLEMVAAGREARVYADRFFTAGTAYALRMDNWTLHSQEALLHPVDRDGLTILRSATTMDYEYRLVSYPSMCCNAPGWSGRVAV